MSSTVKATETEQKELYDMAKTIPFDDRMNHEAEIRDLKLPLIQNYLYEIKSDLLKESETMDFMDFMQKYENCRWNTKIYETFECWLNVFQ